MAVTTYSPKFRADDKPLSKRELVKFIEQLPKTKELSWFTTDARTFEWAEINQDKLAFVGAIKKLQFSRAYMGIFDKRKLETEYKVFRIVGL